MVGVLSPGPMFESLLTVAREKTSSFSFFVNAKGWNRVWKISVGIPWKKVILPVKNCKLRSDEIEVCVCDMIHLI